ncbi:MAG: hypothetical protein MUP66_02615 [Candidatus Nanohaloarchaeota archaeon QJJ-5]|nr:hypothetical protein [Candidatus Nanohaloarchaeota archaeon QJJ-5]
MEPDIESLYLRIKTGLGGVTFQQLKKRSDLSDEALERKLDYLRNQGLIEKEERTHMTIWRPTEDADDEDDD